MVLSRGSESWRRMSRFRRQSLVKPLAAEVLEPRYRVKAANVVFQQQIRRTKSEIRKKSEARNLKSKTPAKAHQSKRRNATVQRLIALSDFVLPSDFDIRISDLRRTPRYPFQN